MPKADPAEKILILIRHAHRDTNDGRTRDNGLSKKGLQQSHDLASFFEGRFGTGKIPMWSSPKKRCVETLEPISKLSGSAIKILPDLDEGPPLEKKIQKILTLWDAGRDAVTVVCTHGDWIPCFAARFLGLDLELSKGGWLEVTRSGKTLKLKWVIQKPTSLGFG